MGIKEIKIEQDIFEENEKLAKIINDDLTKRKIFTVNILGSPGSGKTSFLIEILKLLNNENKMVIEGDIKSDIDTQKIKKLGILAYQINTGGDCHLDAPMIKNALSKIDLIDDSFLFIENIGNLVCPAEFTIGEHIKILIISITEGSDKPYKYPLIFQKASAIILNKIDLKPYVDFDFNYFEKGIRILNKIAPIFEISCKEKIGFENVINWLINQKKYSIL